MQLLFLQARRIAWELQPLGLELFASHGTCQNGGQKVRQTLCVEVDNAGHLSIIGWCQGMQRLGLGGVCVCVSKSI